MSFITIWEFQPLFFWIFFYYILSLLSLHNRYIYVGALRNDLPFSEPLLIFIHFLPFCFSESIILRLSNSFSGSLNWLLSSCSECFIFIVILFYLDLFYNFSLLISSIWWDIIIILSFTSLSMASFSYLNILVMTALKSLSVKSDVWTLSHAVSVAHYHPSIPHMGHIVYLKVSFFVVVKNWTFQIT